MLGYRSYSRRVKLLKGMDYIAFGLGGQFFGAMLLIFGVDAGSAGAVAVEAALVVSTGVLVAGCVKYARFYGLPTSCGLLGIFSFVGVAGLAALPGLMRERERGEGFDVIFARPYRRDVWRMDVRVRIDGSFCESVKEEIVLQLPRGSNVGSAMKMLGGVLPELVEGEAGARFEVNGGAADRRTELSNGDEVVVRGEGDAPRERVG